MLSLRPKKLLSSAKFHKNQVGSDTAIKVMNDTTNAIMNLFIIVFIWDFYVRSGVSGGGCLFGFILFDLEL
jgi:hypothetical protein